MKLEYPFGIGAKFGPLRFCAYRSDGQPMMSSAFVRDAIAIERFLLICTGFDAAANDEHFFGPTEAA